MAAWEVVVVGPRRNQQQRRRPGNRCSIAPQQGFALHPAKSTRRCFARGLAGEISPAADRGRR